MTRLFRYFVHNTYLVTLISAFTLIVGIAALLMMKRDLHPPFEFNVIEVEAFLPGANPQEMEKYVTYPMEEAVRGLPGLEKMESSSRNGSAQIILTYQAGYDKMQDAVERVRSRLEEIRSRLPAEIRSITVERERSDKMFIFYLAFQGLEESNEIHRQFILNFEKDVLNVPGIVNAYKDLTPRDVYIEFDPKKLAAFEISISDVRRVLLQGLNFSPIGQAKVKDDLYSVQIAKTTNDLKDIENLSLRSTLSGHQVRLKDVAGISYKLSDQIDENFINGQPFSGMWVLKDASGDAVVVKEKVLELVTQANVKAPKGIKVVPVMDGPRFIEQQISILMNNGFWGFLLVMSTLFIFLTWQTSLLTALGVPFSYLTTFLVLHYLGIKIDLLSIIGMILVIGILVDDSIIICEHHNGLLSKGYDPKEAAVKTAQDMIVPVTGGLLTTVAAFLPMLFIKSEIAYVLAAIPIVVIATLVFSWIECFFILPNHLGHFCTKPLSAKKESLNTSMKEWYKYLLQWCLRMRYAICAGMIVMLGLSGYIAVKHLQHSFDLNIGREQISIYGALKQSDSIAETRQKMKPLQEYLMSFPKNEVENVVLSIGRIWMDGSAREGRRFVKVTAYVNTMEKYPKRLLKTLKERVEGKIKEFQSEDFEKLYVEIDRKESEERKQEMVRVQVAGGDAVDFKELEEKVSGAVTKLKSIKEYVPDPSLYQKAWVFVPYPEKVVRYGLDAISVGQQIRGFFTPHEVMETRIGGEKLYVYTEVKGRQKLDFKNLSDFEVISPAGSSVPLSFIGEWKEQESFKTIAHRDGQRALNLDFKVNTDTANKTTAQAEVDKVVQDLRKRYPMYDITSKNTNENEEKNQSWSLQVALMCIALVFFVIAVTLGSVTQTLIVSLPIPFGLIGIILALYAHNMPLGLMSMIGLIGTVGVSVNASIIIVDQMNSRVKEQGGKLTQKIIIDACADRLRAILLTTLTTLVGLFPMAYAWGGESGFTQPLAFSMAWGLTYATVLTLFALPALLQIQEDISGFFNRRFKRGKKIDAKTLLPEFIEIQGPEEEKELVF